MFAVIVIIYQLVLILFMSIFGRTSQTSTLTSTYYSLASDILALMLAFTLLYTPYRKLSLFSLIALLLTISFAAQTDFLFGTFWTNVFSNGFKSSFQISIQVIIQGLFAAMACLITVLDFVGMFPYWQVYFAITTIMAAGFGLVQGVVVDGLDTFDGGAGISVFLYSGICSLMIWVICIRGQVRADKYKIKQSYINQTLSMIGLMIAFTNWPKFNMAGALATSYNDVNTTNIAVTDLMNSAINNTFLGLTTAVLTSVLFSSKDTKEDKMKFKSYIDCFINGGIVIASFQDIVLNPAACMVLTCFSSIVTLIVHKYFVTPSQSQSEGAFKTMMKNYSKIIFRIFFAFIGSIIASIVVATRKGTSPQLLSDTGSYSRIAGFQIVAFILTLVIGVAFGAIIGIFIKFYLNYREKQLENAGHIDAKPLNAEVTDYDFFEGLSDQMHPLYYDIFEQINNKQEQKINIADYTTMVIKQALLGAQDNPLRMMSVSKPYQTRVDPVKPEASVDVASDRQEEGAIKINKPLTAQKSKLRISEDEKIPKETNNVARKLNYDEDPGSEIKDQRSPVRSQIRY